MKRFLKISAIVLAYFILCAKSCNDRQQDDAAREQELAHAAQDSIAAVFSVDTLSPATLKSFEQTALCKLSDFSDYLQIVTDPATDPVFKRKTAEMILDLFIPGEVRLDLSIPGRQDSKDVSLKDLLNPGWKNSLTGKAAFDSVRVKKAFQMENDTLCSGQLVFNLGITDPAKATKFFSGSTEKTVDIFAARRQKVFGRDTLKIWKVLLGHIH